MLLLLVFFAALLAAVSASTINKHPYYRTAGVWNAAGEEPPGLSTLQGAADTAIWVGDWALPPQQQGLTVLGTPLGSDEYVRLRLAQKREEHDRLLQRVPLVKDLQALVAAALLRRPEGQLPPSRSAARRDGRVCCLSRLRCDSLPRHAPGPCGRTAAPPVGASGTLATTLWWLGPARGHGGPPCCVLGLLDG